MNNEESVRIPRFLNWPSKIKGRRKWHERYLKRFEQLESRADFINDCEALGAQLEDSVYIDESINKLTSELLEKYSLPGHLIDFLVRYLDGRPKRYDLIHPPVSVQVEQRGEGHQVYKSLTMSLVTKATRAEIRGYLDEEWDGDLKEFINQLPEEKPDRYHPSQATHERIMAMTNKGLSSQEIANEVGFDPGYIRRVRSKMRKPNSK